MKIHRRMPKMNAIERMKSRGTIPTAVLYARFSSDNQREESIDAQLRAMRDYCQRSGVVVTREYCDRARSATTDDRPEFLSMIADSKQRDFDFVVVHKLDRFSRNRYDSAYYKRELKKNGIVLLSVLEQVDDSPESIILESVLEGMSEYFSKNLAREVMKGMRESAMKCQAVGGRPLYGYNHGDLRCRNKDVNRNYLEDFIFKRVGEIVFSEERIPELIESYYASQEELSGDADLTLNRLNVNLKDTQRKLDNIVSVITQTGSPSLLQTLEKLESEKQTLTVQIAQEEQNRIANRLNEREIVSAYRRAQELFKSGSLPQRKQLLNLYLKRVNVYPEYVEIHLHKVPVNMKKPAQANPLSGNSGEPLPTDCGQGVHILLNSALFEQKLSRSKGRSGTGETKVEASLHMHRPLI